MLHISVPADKAATNQKIHIIENRIIKPAALQSVVSADDEGVTNKGESIQAKEPLSLDAPVDNIPDDRSERNASSELAVITIMEQLETDSFNSALSVESVSKKPDEINDGINKVDEQTKESSRTLITVTTIPAALQPDDSGKEIIIHLDDVSENNRPLCFT